MYSRPCPSEELFAGHSPGSSNLFWTWQPKTGWRIPCTAPLCQVEEGNNFPWSAATFILINIVQYVVCPVRGEDVPLAHTELGIHCNLQVLSCRAFTEPFGFQPVLMLRVIQPRCKILFLLGELHEVSVGPRVKFLKVCLDWTSTVWCFIHSP